MTAGGNLTVGDRVAGFVYGAQGMGHGSFAGG